MRRLGSRYILDERIGKGAQGEVWIGRASGGHSRDTVPETFAFKILRTDLVEEPGFVERFIKERSTLLRVSSPYVINVRDFVVEGTTLALVMDYVPGGDLRGYVKKFGPLPPADVAHLGAAVAEGLTAVHDAGILHRDVKPANILLDFSTTPMTPRVVDFGIARIIDAAGASRLTGVIGTPLYMAPEVLSGEIPGTQADIYSLGVVLYEMCCGVTPFVGSISELLGQHLHRVPGRPEGLPDPLWNLISAMLLKVPQRRPTAADVASNLRALMPEFEGIPAAPQIQVPPASIPSTELADAGMPVPSAQQYPQAAFAATSPQVSASSPISYVPNQLPHTLDSASSFPGVPQGYGQTMAGGYGTQSYPHVSQTARIGAAKRRGKKRSRGKIAFVSLTVVALVAAGAWGVGRLIGEEEEPKRAVADLPAGSRFFEQRRIKDAYSVTISPDRSLLAASDISKWTLYHLTGENKKAIATKRCYDSKTDFWNNSSFLCDAGSSATIIRSNGDIYQPPGPNSHNLVGTDGKVTVVIADRYAGDIVGLNTAGKEIWRAYGEYHEAIVQNGFVLSYDTDKKLVRILSVTTGTVLQSVDTDEDPDLKENPHPLGFGIDAGMKAFYRIENGFYTIWDAEGKEKFRGKAKVTPNNWVISSPEVSPKDLKDLFDASPDVRAVSILGDEKIKVAKVDNSECKITIDKVRFNIPKVDDQDECYINVLGISGDDDTLLVESSNDSDKRKRRKPGSTFGDNEGAGKVIAYSLSTGGERWRAEGSFVALLGDNRMVIRPKSDQVIIGTIKED